MVMSDRVRTVEDKPDDREDSHSAQHTARGSASSSVMRATRHGTADPVLGEPVLGELVLVKAKWVNMMSKLGLST